VTTVKKSMSISWSRLREWMTCHWRYQLNYELGWTPRKVAEPLYYGTIFHSIMDYIYSEVRKPNPGYKRRNRKALRAKLRREGMRGEDLEQMLDWVLRYIAHIERYKEQEPRSVIASEFAFKIPLDISLMDEIGPPWYSFSDTYSDIFFVGIMDLIVARRKTIEIWDHKLQANHPRRNELDHPTISYPQMGIYAWASRELGFPVERSVLNVFGKRRKSDNIQRYPIKVTDEEAEQWRRWVHSKAAEMLSNPDRSKSLGSMYCGFCNYKYPCIKHQTEGESGLTRALNADYESKSTSYRSKIKWHESFTPDQVVRMDKEVNQ